MTKLEELQKAKENVRYLLDNAESLVDMHGLLYWAGVVVSLREAIVAEL